VGSLLDIAEVAAAPRAHFRGLDLPARFADPAAECRAMRAGAAVFDGALRAWTIMRGEDRASFLQGMVTNDVALPPGSTAYAAILTQQGRVVTDLRVNVAEDHYVLDFPAHAAEAARAALERFIVADDVEMEADQAVLIGVEGRRAGQLLQAVGLDAAPAFGASSIGGCAVRVAPASHAGEPGVLLACAAGDAAAVWNQLRAAGAEPVGFEALDVLRLEAAIPWVGVDMDEETLIMEADLEAAISFRKGCYLGQEVVERVAARGHVNRKRVGLWLDGGPVPARSLLSADGKEVGWITSSAVSPTLARTIAMGYVRREHLAVGTRLELAAGGIAEVTALPFVARDS
jgi:folate-binding protein YgfZ